PWRPTQHLQQARAPASLASRPRSAYPGSARRTTERPGPAAMSHTYPYPRPSLTVDVVLVTRESEPRVLLIRRKHDPFAGAWALPGGFADENESLAAAARRELQEETGVHGGV